MEEERKRVRDRALGWMRGGFSSLCMGMPVVGVCLGDRLAGGLADRPNGQGQGGGPVGPWGAMGGIIV